MRVVLSLWRELLTNIYHNVCLPLIKQSYFWECILKINWQKSIKIDFKTILCGFMCLGWKEYKCTLVREFSASPKKREGFPGGSRQ